MRTLVYRLLASFLAGSAVVSATAWDYEGHRLINQLALASLPPDFPAFVCENTAAERIAFLAGEPDRWRNSPDLSLRHASGPDHYIDIEELHDYGIDPKLLPIFRVDFTSQLALTRKENPSKFPDPPASRNEDHTQQLVGLLPWSMTESYGKLKSGFSYLRAYQDHGGTVDEVRNAQENIIYMMGVMGHWTGDGAQPLHTTVHHHGWAGANPEGYTTNRSIHSWIDGGFVNSLGGLDYERLKARLRPARLLQITGREAKPEEFFQAAVEFLLEQHRKVEAVYRLEKNGAFKAGAVEGAGRTFIEDQYLLAAQMLGDTYYSAWKHAPPDTFLQGYLAKRAAKKQEK